MKRILSLILAVLMIVSAMPVSVIAEEVTTAPSVSSETTSETQPEGPVVTTTTEEPHVVTTTTEEAPAVTATSEEIPVVTTTTEDTSIVTSTEEIPAVTTTTDVVSEVTTTEESSVVTTSEEVINEQVSSENLSAEVPMLMATTSVLYSGTCGDNLTWTLTSDGTLTISGTGEMTSSPWRDSYSDVIKSVIIEDGVTSIGDWAFEFCSSLTSVTIPDSVTSIGMSAFEFCSSLTSINIPNSVTSISEGAFYECSSLTSINIPDSVTSIGDRAFEFCSSLTSLNIPDSVTSISDYTFSGCSSLTSINIPNSVTSIGDFTFSGCSSLTSINIPNSVTSIGDFAFDVCWDLTSITFESATTKIFDSEHTIPDTATIYGYEGSTAQAYAEKYYRKFCLIHDECIFGDWIETDNNTHERACTVENCPTVETAEHIWDKGVITTEPTHTTFGVKTYTCSDCSATKTENVDKLTGHTFGDWTKVDDEIHKHICACGEVETAEHIWDKGVITTEPTHTTFGVKTYTCSDCSATKTEEVTKLEGHTFGEWVKVDETNRSRSCECGKAETEEHNFIDGICAKCNYSKVIRGDVNGDNSVNNADAIYLLYNVIFGDSAYPVNQDCDFNGDGIVSNADAIYLLYHVIFGEAYPLK